MEEEESEQKAHKMDGQENNMSHAKPRGQLDLSNTSHIINCTLSKGDSNKVLPQFHESYLSFV
jgi:hypothetical protein